MTLQAYLNYDKATYVSGKPELEIKITDKNRCFLPAKYKNAEEIFISKYEITWKLNKNSNSYEFCYVSPTDNCFTGVIYDVDACEWERQDLFEENELIQSFKRMMNDHDFAANVFNSYEWQDEA